MTEEAQQSQEVPEDTVKEPEHPETIVENAENAIDNSVKKRGRPAGSKDKAPRKKKVVVVEEDVSEKPPEPPALPEPHAEPSTHIDVKPSKAKPTTSRKEKPEPEPEPEPEPLSPGTVMREA